MFSSSALHQRFQTWLSENPDEAILRYIFRGLLTVAIAVFLADLAATQRWIVSPDRLAMPDETPSPDLPNLAPSILVPKGPHDDRRTKPMPQPGGELAKPMTFELVSGGRLMATGTIVPGISQNFAAEVGRRGEYIRTVVLSSPGGSVTDALLMGRLIREKKLATEVEVGSYCASSCPLVFFGGVERRAANGAKIGVHQVSTATSVDNRSLRDEMSIAQAISARCEHYLYDMGIDLQVWMHAMETPRAELFVFTPEELKVLNVVTPLHPMPSKN